MIAKRAPEAEKRLLVGILQTGVGDDRVRDARPPELDIGAVKALPVKLHRVIRPEHRRVGQADAVAAAVDALAGDEARRRFHALRPSGKTVLIAVAADAPRAVSAHLAHRAVGVIKPHGVVRIALRALDRHEAVGADGHVPVAQCSRKLRQPAGGDVSVQIVEDDEIIPRAVHFCKVQVSASLPWYSFLSIILRYDAL